MTFTRLQEEHATLCRLLSSERAALAEKDESKLRSIDEQINSRMTRLTEPLDLEPGNIDPQEVRELRAGLSILLEEIETTRKAWSAYQVELEAVRRELDNGRRFMQEFQNPRPGKKMVHHSA